MVEGTSLEYVTPDNNISHGKPEHLITCDKRWADYPKNETKGMDCRHNEYMERYRGNDRAFNERDIEERWILEEVDREHEHTQ
mmetsp:Transcript_30935/g.56074  ORF Transcript_30935/g.56074 Transcript_30935/m.56074 type:complete len:83 (+) Transcript_30935:864-1112(+)